MTDVASPIQQVVTIDAVTDPLWERLVTTRDSDIFHSPAWLRSLRDTYGLALEANVAVDESGNPIAGFVYSAINDMMDPRIVSLPFSDFCDALVDTPQEWDAVSRHVIGTDCRSQLKCLHSTIPMDDPLLSPAGRARWHAVDLNRSSDEIWDGIASSARRSIRKARNQGVEVRLGTSIDDMRAFFELHLRVRKHKYGLLAQPWNFFENVWKNLLDNDHGDLFLAFHEDVLLGGVVLLEWQDTLYYKFNASDAEALGLRPNDLVIWETIQHGVERGLGRFDFGLSDWDQEGLLRFKRKYATEEKTIQTLRHMPAGTPSERESQTRAVLPHLTELFTDPSVPDEVTEKAGNLLYRFFT